MYVSKAHIRPCAELSQPGALLRLRGDRCQVKEAPTALPWNAWEPGAAPGLRALSALRAGPSLTLLLWTGGELKDDVPMALPERRDSSCSQPDPA